MTDRELLELAAKAAKLSVFWGHPSSDCYDHNKLYLKQDKVVYTAREWNPLEDDGDAFRLAVDLGLVADFSRPSAGKPYKQHAIWLDETMSNAELARRAIVCAAAEVGRKMK